MSRMWNPGRIQRREHQHVSNPSCVRAQSCQLRAQCGPWQHFSLRKRLHFMLESCRAALVAQIPEIHADATYLFLLTWTCSATLFKPVPWVDKWFCKCELARPRSPATCAKNTCQVWPLVGVSRFTSEVLQGIYRLGKIPKLQDRPYWGCGKAISSSKGRSTRQQDAQQKFSKPGLSNITVYWEVWTGRTLKEVWTDCPPKKVRSNLVCNSCVSWTEPAGMQSGPPQEPQ